MTLPIATYENDTNYYYGGGFQATGGSVIELPLLSSISGYYSVNVQAEGDSSEIDLPVLSTFDTSYTSSLSATQAGTINLSSSPSVQSTLNSLTNVNVTVDAQSTLNLTYVTGMVGGSLTFQGASDQNSPLTLSSLVATSLYVGDGGYLSLPDLTTYTDTSSYNATFSATGSNSVLDLANLTTITGGTLDLLADGQGAVIDLLGVTTYSDSGTITTQDGGAIEFSASLTSLTGVTLTIESTAGAGLLDQLKSFTNGQLYVEGGAMVATSELTDIDGSSFFVNGGSSLSLPGVQADNVTPGFLSLNFQASGANSLLSLPNLTSITTAVNYAPFIIEAYDGGDVELPSLASLSATDSYSYFELDSYGTGSVLDLPALSSVTIVNSNSSYYNNTLTATGGATIELGSGLVDLDLFNLTLDSTSAMTVSGSTASFFAQLTSLNEGTITIGGQTDAFTHLASINGTSISLTNGANSSLPDVAAVADPAPGGGNIDSTYSATGGSTLSFPVLSSLTGSTVNLIANASQIDLPDLSTLTATSSGSISATNGASISFPATLTALNLFSITVDGTSTVELSQIVGLTNGSLTIEGGSFTLPALTDLNGSNLTVEGGGTLVLSELASYTGTSSSFYAENIFQATGSGSSISFPILTEITTPDQYYGLSIQAYAGGQVAIPLLASLNNTNANPSQVGLNAEGPQSKISVPSLTTINNYDTNGQAVLEATSGATLIDPLLTSLNEVLVTVDGQSTLDYAGWTSLTNSAFTTTGGTFDFSPGATSLSNVDGTSFYVYGGGHVSLPGVTTITNPGYAYLYLEASGSQSVLDLSNLTSISSVSAEYQIQAVSGGHVLLSGLAALTPAGTPYLQFEASGSGSLIDLSILTTLDLSSGILSDIEGATINDPVLTSLNGRRSPSTASRHGRLPSGPASPMVFSRRPAAPTPSIYSLI